MVRALEVSIDLRAEEAVGERVLGVAGDTRGSPALDRRQGGTGVRAVVRTPTTHDARIALR
jgi:hypothetical protein